MLNAMKIIRKAKVNGVTFVSVGVIEKVERFLKENNNKISYEELENILKGKDE